MKNTKPGIPHSRQDCIELKMDGKHVGYVCYHHASQAIAKLEDGDDTVTVDRWGIKPAFDKGVTCDFGD